jgi:hypothetical protein
MRTLSTHEDYSRAHPRQLSSERSFGFIFGGFLLLVGLIPILRGHPLRPWAVGFSVVFFVVALVRPLLLRPLNRLWAEVGVRLNQIVNPIVTGLMFFALFTPTAWLSRLAGRDPLRIRCSPNEQSYWIQRNPASEGSDGMRHQF